MLGRSALALVLLAASAAAQPRIFSGGVMNAAGLARGGLPGASLARGALITILGENLGPGRVVVTITDARGAAHLVTPLYAVAGQINAVLPCAAATGDARFTVTVDGRTGPLSDPFRVVDQNFQLFTRNQKGFGPAIAEQLTEEGPRLNWLVSPASPGRAIALWGTGLGTCDPAASRPVGVWIGGQPALVLARRPSPEVPGIDQLIVLIPWNAPRGCFVPVAVRSGRDFSHFTTVSVGPESGTCLDKWNGFTLLIPELQQGPLTWARIHLLHGTTLTGRPGLPVLQTASEQGEAAFVRSTLESLAETAYLPPPGGCLVRPLGSTLPAGAPLDAGSLTLRGPWDLFVNPDPADGIYRRRLAPTPFDDRSGDFLRPQGRYAISGSGGRQVGQFEVSVTLPDFLRWTNREELPFGLNRSLPVVVQWTGGDPTREFVLIRGFSFDRGINRGREFACTAAVTAGAFQLPDSVVWSLPVTEQDFFLSVGNAPLLGQFAFQASGLESGFLTYELSTGRNFALQ